MTFCYEREHSKATFFYVLKQKEKFDIFRGHKHSRKSLSDFFAEETFADLGEIREIRESFCPRKFLRLKYSEFLKSFLIFRHTKD